MFKEFVNSVKRKDIVISLLILGVTFGYYLDEYIPKGITKIDLYFFEIGSFGFDDILELVQYTKMKLLIICFSVIWYFTCKHWWKPATLVIIIIELLKLISVFKLEQYLIDEIEYLTSLPITLPIIIGVVIISYKINHFNLAKNVRLKIDNEIDTIFFELDKTSDKDLVTLREKFLKTKKFYSEKTKDNYIKELISLRDEFYKI